MDNSNSSSSTIKYNENEERLDSLREWYQRRSKEFASPNYPKYKCRKEMSMNSAKEYSEYERKHELKCAMFERKFNEDISAIASTVQPRIQLPIEVIKVENYIKTIQETTLKRNIQLTMPWSYINPTPLLKPENLLVFVESEIAESEKNSASNFDKIREPAFIDQEVKSKSNSTNIVSKEDFKNNNKTTGAFFNTQESIFLLWLKTYSKFYLEIQKEIKLYEQDSNKKETRVNLTRTLVDRINDCAKRNCTTQELAQLSIFIGNLFEGKPVKSWKDDEFQLDLGDRSGYFYAMNTIFDRYFEQIKWDTDLMDQIFFVLILLFRREPRAYQIFCGKVVTSLVLLNFDIDKLLHKIDSIANETAEISSKWIQNEQIIFRLFCKVQIGVCSTTENTWQKLGDIGPIDLLTIFTEVIEAPKPFPLCTAFVLEGILNNALKQLIKDIGQKLTKIYFPIIKKNLLTTGEKIERAESRSQFTLTTKQNFLNGLLEDAITRIEGQMGSKA